MLRVNVPPVPQFGLGPAASAGVAATSQHAIAAPAATVKRVSGQCLMTPWFVVVGPRPCPEMIAGPSDLLAGALRNRAATCFAWSPLNTVAGLHVVMASPNCDW